MENEVVVELLGEGGSRALYAVRAGDEWLFSSNRLIGAIPSVAEPTEGIAMGLQAALEQLDHFRGWYELFPKDIHPKFRDELMDAVVARGASAESIERWVRACHLAESALGPVVTSTPVHASDDWLYLEEPEMSDTVIEATREELRGLGISEETIDLMAPRRSPVQR